METNVSGRSTSTQGGQSRYIQVCGRSRFGWIGGPELAEILEVAVEVDHSAVAGRELPRAPRSLPVGQMGESQNLAPIVIDRRKSSDCAEFALDRLDRSP